jgi:hypothetical protein
MSIECSVLAFGTSGDLFMVLPIVGSVLAAMLWALWRSIVPAPGSGRLFAAAWISVFLVAAIPVALLSMYLFELKTDLSLDRYERCVIEKSVAMRHEGFSRTTYVRPCFGVFRMTVYNDAGRVEARLSLATAARVSIVYSSDGEIHHAPASSTHKAMQHKWYRQHVPNPS